MKRKPAPPSKHLSTEFHFDGGWAVEFIKKIGSGHAVTVTLNTVIRGEPVERLFEFPAHQSNMPTQRNARTFCRRAMNRETGETNEFE